MPTFDQLDHAEYITLHPKLELHAHVSGSINERHLVSLIKQHWPRPEDYEEKLNICKLSPDNHHDTRSLDECFALFNVLHHIIDSVDIIHEVTLQVLEDFIFRDHCVYIELRTTPRNIKNQEGEIVVTMEQYMGTIVNAIKEFRMIMAFLAHKYQISTILAENDIEIPFHTDINQYSPYGQKIITRFDEFFPVMEIPTTENSTTITQLSLDATSPTSNNIPIPLTSPLSPYILTDMNDRINNVGDKTIISLSTTTNQTNDDSPTTPSSPQHYHTNQYTLSSIALSISSFVSAGILFSFDRATFTHDNCEELLNCIEKLMNEEDDKNIIQNQGNSIKPVPNSTREIVVGLDFSGNPFAKNLFNFFLDFWKKAAQIGLYTSIHFAETKNDTDSNEILTFKPYRLGHAAVLNEEMRDAILMFNNDDKKGEELVSTVVNTQSRPKMGIEVCLSSNKACKLHMTMNNHPVVGWIEYNNQIIKKYFSELNDNGQNNENITHFPSISSYSDLIKDLIPITLCTDDSGVFSCSLVDEWLQMLTLDYFNHELSTQSTPLISQPHGCYTYPIKSLKDPNEPTKSVSIEAGCQKFHGVDIVRSKFDDFIRINNFAQTGIQSIFQKHYIDVVYQVFERFRPV